MLTSDRFYTAAISLGKHGEAVSRSSNAENIVIANNTLITDIAEVKGRGATVKGAGVIGRVEPRTAD